MRALLFLTLFLAPLSALAHHLDDYDAHIRQEAKLPTAWFSCHASKDCDLVPVPCRSGLAVNSRHIDEARAALVDAYPFCLGSALDDTEAACEEGQCVTRAHKD